MFAARLQPQAAAVAEAAGLRQALDLQSGQPVEGARSDQRGLRVGPQSWANVLAYISKAASGGQWRTVTDETLKRAIGSKGFWSGADDGGFQFESSRGRRGRSVHPDQSCPLAGGSAASLAISRRSFRVGSFTSMEDVGLSSEKKVRIAVDQAHSVSGLLQVPRQARACYVVAHGAGAGMTHSFMSAVANGLYERRIATFRYQFPYMEQGLKRPDRPTLAHATVRAAIDVAGRLTPSLPLFAGGKSFGGRMTSQAQAEMPLPRVQGLIFLGFPLHPANKPSDERAQHLSHISIPMLFLQGSRDPLADMRLLVAAIGRLGGIATLLPLDGADHSFHVLARSGRTDTQVLAEALDALVAWTERENHIGL